LVRSIVNLLPFVLIGLVFWLLLIRPAQARQRRAAQMQSELLPGARIITTAGLYATVVALEDDAVVLETSPGVISRWARGAVGQVLADSTDGTGANAGQGTDAAGDSISLRKSERLDKAPSTSEPPSDSTD
jgi:preprotein translocase subunit YajC